MTGEWKLAKRRSGCGACGRAFAEGEAHLSSLSIAGDELARDDLCLACWGARGPGAALVWWRTRRVAERKRGLALDLDALETLFVRLGEREELAWRELRYVLALILMRKRRLRVAQVVREPEGEALVVHRPRRTERITVPVFDFPPERLDELRARLQEVFEGEDLEPAAEPPEESAEPGPAPGPAATA
jgi:hypothetical protein